MLENSDGEMLSPNKTGNINAVDGYDQSPMCQWRVSDDEEDSVPISQLLGANKEKVRGHRKDNSAWGKRMEKELGQIERRQQAKDGGSNPTVIPYIRGIKVMSAREADECAEFGEVLRWSEDEEGIPNLFQKGHSNLGKECAKYFEAVLHYGTVTEVIPRRKGYYYKITYEDGDQEDMDEGELIFAIELKQNKKGWEEVQNEAEVLSGLSEEGSAYDSEEDNKALKEAKKKRKAGVATARKVSKRKRSKAPKWTVCPESVANVGGPDSMLGKSMSR
jgi:hypothetical protein